MEHTLGLAVSAKTRSGEDKRSIATENATLIKLVKTVMQRVENFDLKEIDV